jgi:hypothetical protein
LLWKIQLLEEAVVEDPIVAEDSIVEDLVETSWGKRIQRLEGAAEDVGDLVVENSVD